MDIRIDENYKITSDKDNFIVSKKKNIKNKKTGIIEDRWVMVEFHPCFEMLVSDVLEGKLRASDAKSFKEAVNTLNDLKSLSTKLSSAYTAHQKDNSLSN